MEKQINSSADIILGMRVRDKVTGYTGIATACTHYLNGCDRISVAPPVEKDKPGVLPESYSFDWMQLEIVDNGIADIPPKIIPAPIARTGGPQREATLRR